MRRHHDAALQTDDIMRKVVAGIASVAQPGPHLAVVKQAVVASCMRVRQVHEAHFEER